MIYQQKMKGKRVALLNGNTRNEEFADFADNKGFTYVPSYFDNAFQEDAEKCIATVYKGNIIKNLIMDCQSYTKYRPNETTGGIFVSWRRKEELPTGA